MQRMAQHGTMITRCAKKRGFRPGPRPRLGFVVPCLGPAALEPQQRRQPCLARRTRATSAKIHPVGPRTAPPRLQGSDLMELNNVNVMETRPRCSLRPPARFPRPAARLSLFRYYISSSCLGWIVTNRSAYMTRCGRGSRTKRPESSQTSRARGSSI